MAKKMYKKKSNYRKPKKAFKKRGKTPLKRMVKRMIAQTEEVKSIQQFLSDKVLNSTGHVNFPNNVIVLGPNPATLALAQGTGQGTRVGNKVTTKKLLFKGIISPLEWNTTTNPNPRPMQVMCVIFYDREDPNAAPVPGSNFFQDGSSSTGFTGTLMDIVKPFNTDRYRILKQKRFKLGFAANTGTATSTSNQAQFQAYTNNDFKLNCEFSMDLTKYYPKTVKFNDNLSDPMTRGLYALFYYIACDGTVFSGSQIAAEINYMQDYRFTDA